MSTLLPNARSLLCAALLIPGAAPLTQAATAQIDSFSASATQVTAGSSVEFSLSFTVLTTQWLDGGSNLEEPPPQEGTQYWSLNWYSYESENLRDVYLSAGDQTYSEQPNAQAGTSYTNTWNFSMLFPTAGSFEITANGGWRTHFEFYTSNEIALRDCTNIDPGGSNQLECTAWVYEYPEYSDSYDQEGPFAPLSLTIEVLPVPEPQAWLMALAGLGGLGWRLRRRAT
jgi:MYXO-CTERM domain-containing protein